MNSGKTKLLVFLLFLIAGISSNLIAQEKKVHVKVITNGKVTDTIFSQFSSSGSIDSDADKIVIVTNSDQIDNSGHDMDSIIMSGKHHNMKYVIRRNGGPDDGIDHEIEMLSLSSANDTTITQISPLGDTIKIHRLKTKDGKIQMEVMVNKHSGDSIGNQFYAYKFKSDKNHIMSRKMRVLNQGDEDFEFSMPPMPPPGMEGMNFDYYGKSEGIDENADFGKIKVTPLLGKNIVRISLELSGKENTVIQIKDEKGKAVFEEKVKDLTGKYVRDIDMTGNQKGQYSLGIERGKSNITRQFTF